MKLGSIAWKLAEMIQPISKPTFVAIVPHTSLATKVGNGTKLVIITVSSTNIQDIHKCTE